ncbi:MAG: aspartate--tRNA(Asn) ligase [Clostridiales bacterium]|nr:aspartate--tRNA(Asn) ligase [Clostridiales bacterium]
MLKQIAKLQEGKVKCGGMIDTIRDKKNIQFVILKDASGKIQLTVDKVSYPEVGEVFSHLLPGATVEVEGNLVLSEYVKMGGKEILVESVNVTSTAEASPITEDTSIDQRIDYRWIDLRSQKNLLMFKVQTLVQQCFREFLIERDFIEIHSPKLIGAASESGSDVFEVKYFDTKAYLAQSPQFYKQMAIAGGFGRVFECGAVFRAEKSHSRKHATEFTGFDLEFSGIESYKDIMVMEEELLEYTLRKLKDKYGEEISQIFGVSIVVPKLPFPRIKLADLYAELESLYGYTIPESERDDMTTEAEKLCKQYAMGKFGHEFIFVTDFGARKRAFYHLRENGIPQGYDLVWKGMEITTGAQREHRYEILKSQAREIGLEKDVEFYLQFFKYGCPPHGGFGLGLDRFMINLLDLNIKEVQFVFRGPDRLTP